MIVDTVFQPILFADLRPGTFFKVVRDRDQFFGLAASNSQGDLCAILFTKSQVQTGVPWYSTAGGINATVLAVPDAVIRPDYDSMKPDDGAIPFGAIISDAAGNYIRASAGIGNTITFNVGNGARVNLQEHLGSPVIYPRWSVGTVVDGELRTIFQFPLATSSSAPLKI